MKGRESGGSYIFCGRWLSNSPIKAHQISKTLNQHFENIEPKYFFPTFSVGGAQGRYGLWRHCGVRGPAGRGRGGTGRGGPPAVRRHGPVLERQRGHVVQVREGEG
jgi:hypothetical protein